jgi:dienelactone hydrolase
LPAGLTLLNAAAEWRRGATIDVSVAGGAARTTAVPDLAPLAVRRIAFEIGAPVPLAPEAREADAKFTLRDAAGREIHSLSVKLAVRSAREPHKRTFVSGIDGSVQYFAVVPAAARPDGASSETKPALVLTLHGAGVQASGQAACYAPREWATIVAPTNRRVFGFDWEDWGRIDAMEALARAESLFLTDPRRTYLTGHSMGGHGTWSIGAAYPGRFAAIAPSAGWSDFWSYTGAQALSDADPVQAMLARAANSSRTRLLDRNFALAGVYVLHGDADETVPVREARAMRARLAEFHTDFAYYERPGAGHWWGNECVDWPPLGEFLKSHARRAPETVTSVEFTTVNPAITFECDWVTLWAQERSLEPSRVEARIDPKAGKIEVKTENAAEIVLDIGAWRDGAAGYEIAIDGATLTEGMRTSALIRLERGADRAWRQIGGYGGSLGRKGAHRAGPFKDAFRNRMVFVYGTRGSPEENAWAFAKARYDSETFYYRGNGCADLLADTEFDADADPGRNVILYGNADGNAAWGSVLENSPVEVRRGSVRVGEKRLAGPDLACFFIRPRKGSDAASVGVVAGTGLFGCRLTDQFPYFTSGIAYPDWTVIGADMLDVGAAGVRGAGFFARDWTVDPAQSAWR